MADHTKSKNRTPLPPGRQLTGKVELTGWGRTSHALSTIGTPDSEEAWADTWTHARDHRGVTVRGAGRSYGDAAVNSAGDIVKVQRSSEGCLLDPITGLMTASGGVTLSQVMQVCVPQGWLPPVLPGTAHITLGGALASDVHGKNHLQRGSFSQHVTQAQLRTPGQGVIQIAPGTNAKQFWATAGGMGLTGVIEEVQFQLIPISSSEMHEEQTVVKNFDGLLAQLESSALTHEHAVAWIDGSRKGSNFGSGIVTKADHIPADQLSGARSNDPLGYKKYKPLNLPPRFNTRLTLMPLLMAANSFRLRHCRTESVSSSRSITSVLNPLDKIGGWNQLYGREGFVQYQCVVPHASADVLAQALRMVQSVNCAPTLAVLKCLGEQTPAPLGFPLRGWTLAMDFRPRPALVAALNYLDNLVVAAGGRVYLTKDSRLSPDVVHQMYPGLKSWQAICDELDPDRLLTSDLNRRLRLRPSRPQPPR